MARCPGGGRLRGLRPLPRPRLRAAARPGRLPRSRRRPLRRAARPVAARQLDRGVRPLLRRGVPDGGAACSCHFRAVPARLPLRPRVRAGRRAAGPRLGHRPRDRARLRPSHLRPHRPPLLVRHGMQRRAHRAPLLRAQRPRVRRDDLPRGGPRALHAERRPPLHGNLPARRPRGRHPREPEPLHGEQRRAQPSFHARVAAAAAQACPRGVRRRVRGRISTRPATSCARA